MRHGKKFPHLGRKKGHRNYMLANMACSLIEHKSINTTLTKAKALKMYIEPIITKSKNDSTHNRRIAFRYLRNKYAVTELFRDISVKVGDRPGGYTRVIKLGNRLGDNAEMALIELVDYNQSYTTDKPDSKKRRRRRRKGSENKIIEEAPAVEEAPAEETPDEETPAEETPAVEEAPVTEEAPAEETPAVEEAPAEETPAVEEAPVTEEAPAEETPAEEAPAAEKNDDNNDNEEKK